MHHSLDKVIPDSAPTATALATGNKTFDGGLSVFPDGTDCAFGSAATAATLKYALDNPRIETIAEYLKRRFGYRVGLVTTASVADATPAAFGAHTGDRDTAFEVVRQYLENPFLNGQPAPDVLMGGGGESFNPALRPDKRDLLAEFNAKGYTIITSNHHLKQVGTWNTKLVGIFKTAQTTMHSSGVRASSTAHMNVAYDKLRLTRPGSEPLPDFAGWEDQPFLDLMTQKAIEILAGPDGKQPFFLMVEAASIDKQSHSNHFAGAAWDVIEFDKAVGAGRAWAAARKPGDTLMVATADHGQSMVIIGLADIADRDYFDRGGGLTMTVPSPIGTHTTRIYKDVSTNVRMMIPWGSAGSGRTGPPGESFIDVYGAFGFPDYIDADSDGYPENRETPDGKGRRRLAVGFRTGNHTFESLPLSAEGPGALLFTGYFDQTEVPLKIAAAVAHDTADLDAALNKLSSTSAFPKTPGK
jgi:alkaline phosphatase